MIRVQLARRLRDAGLIWRPAEADRFIIPDRGMDERIFTISAMTVEVRDSPVGPLIAFNGVVEWALDAIERREVVWLPREDQLRERLGTTFESLRQNGEGHWECVIRTADQQTAHQASTAAEAYGAAVLALLEQANAELFDAAG